MAKDAAPRKDPTNGTWWFVVDPAPAGDGRRRQAKRRGFKTKAEAQAALDALRVASRQGTYVAPVGQTVGEFFRSDWLPAVRRRLAERTWESYERNIRHHIEPRIGQVQLSSLDGAMLNRLYVPAGERPDPRESVARAQAPDGQVRPHDHPRRAQGRRALAPAADDPAEQATPPSSKAAKPPEMKVWTGPQLATFLDRLGDNRYRWSWLFLATAGCRRGDALGLRWQDVDFERRVVAIRQELIPLTKPSGRGREGRLVPDEVRAPARDRARRTDDVR